MNALIYLFAAIAALAALMAMPVSADTVIGACFSDSRCTKGVRVVKTSSPFNSGNDHVQTGGGCTYFKPTLKNVKVASGAGCYDDETQVNQNVCGSIDGGSVAVVCVKPA